MKKKCLIVANCFIHEYSRHLLQSNTFRNEYEIISYTTYEDVPDDKYLADLKNVDLIISQNVKNIKEYTREFINNNKKSGSTHICTEFWRFDGFWPYQTPNERKNSAFWFPADEFGSDLSFDEYMNYKVDDELIKNTFERELEKFQRIDSTSDIKIFDFFIKNYKNERLFSDHYHPTPIIFQYVTEEILKICDISESVPLLEADTTNSIRYRLITDYTKNILNIKINSSDNTLIFFDKLITTKIYYYFSKHLQTRKDWLSLTMPEIRKIFYDFLEIEKQKV